MKEMQSSTQMELRKCSSGRRRKSSKRVGSCRKTASFRSKCRAQTPAKKTSKIFSFFSVIYLFIYLMNKHPITKQQTISNVEPPSATYI
jgi:hypothetical protein